ncbi:MAG: hypothetical protein ABSE73_19530 [Planctomycetota bacterium]
MKRKLPIFLGIAALVALAVAAVIFVLKHEGPTDVRGMAKSGASEQEMIAKVDKSPAPYELPVDEIISLRKDGVPDSVLVAMLRHGKQTSPAR